MPPVTRYPTTSSIVTTGWTDPQNALADDTVYATAAPPQNGDITTLYTGFGLDAQIPAGSLILETIIEAEHRVDETRSNVELVITPVLGGVVAPENVFPQEPTVDTVLGFTNSTYTRDQLMDANGFGVRVTARRGNNTRVANFFLDFVRITVVWATPRPTVARARFVPPGAPIVGSDLQIARAVVRRTGATSRIPTAKMNLKQQGVIVAELVPSTSISSATGQVLEAVWDAGILPDPSGSNLQLEVLGDGTTDDGVEVGAIRWRGATGAGARQMAATFGLGLSFLQPFREGRLGRSAQYGIGLAFSTARRVDFRRTISYALRAAFQTPAGQSTKFVRFNLGLQLQPRRTVERGLGYSLGLQLRALKEARRTLRYDAPLMFRAGKEVSRRAAFGLLASFSPPAYVPTKVFRYALGLAFQRPARVVHWTRAHALALQLRTLKTYQVTLRHDLGLMARALKEIRPIKAYQARVTFSTSSRYTLIRTVQYALGLALQRSREVRMLRPFSLALQLRRQIRAELPRRYDITLATSAWKKIEGIARFGLGLRFTAAGTLAGVKAAVARNVEVFMQTLRGRRGTIPLAYRIVRSNVLGEDLGLVPGYIRGTGTVGMSNARAHAWELSFDMLQVPTSSFDPVREFVKVYADVTAGSATNSYPLGLYRLAKPSADVRKSHRIWHCKGFSLEDLLARHETDTGYSVPKGTDALLRAQDLIMQHAGVPGDRVLFPAVSAPLRHAQQFDPGSDSSTASWLSIVNQLLNAAGYYAAQTDADGNFVTEKMGSQAVLEPDVRYDESYERMVTGSITDDWNDERFANKIVVRSQDVADTPPLVAKAYNRNPDSEGSINYLGRTVQKTINMQTATSLADLQTMAQAELEKASGYYRKLAVTHLFDPRVWGPRKVYGLELTDAAGDSIISGRWNHLSASVNLSHPAQPMSAEVSRIEEV